MNSNRVQIRAGRNWCCNSVALLIEETTPLNNSGRRRVVTGFTTEDVHDDGLSIQPSLELTDIAAQKLMDNLWALGIRPTEKAGPEAVEAIKRHLDDMRAIAFHKLGLPPVK